jgi:hypothetical protein
MHDELFCGFCDHLVPRGLDACPSCGAPVFELATDPFNGELPSPRFDAAIEVLNADAENGIDDGASTHH